MAEGTRSAIRRNAADNPAAAREGARPKKAQDRFPISLELFILQSFNGDLEEHNQANFENPWYMFNQLALTKFFASPPPDGLNTGSGSSSQITVFSGPQYPIVLALTQHSDKDAEGRLRAARVRRYPDFTVWCLETKQPQAPQPLPCWTVRSLEQAIQYYRGPCTVLKAAPLLFVEVKGLPSPEDLQDFPDDLIEEERKLLTKAQEELYLKVAVYFFGAPTVDQAVALAWAGTNFSWAVITRGIKCKDLDAEDPGPLEVAK